MKTATTKQNKFWFCENTGAGTLGKEIIGDYYLLNLPKVRIRQRLEIFTVFIDEEMDDVNGYTWVESENTRVFKDLDSAMTYAIGLGKKIN